MTLGKRLWQLNSVSREAIHGPTFRNPAPSSQPPYAAPSRTQDPASFHYYTRDNRRNIPSEIVTERPVELIDVESSTASPPTLPSSLIPPSPPGAPLPTWQVSEEQPQAGGYYPITNFK